MNYSYFQAIVYANLPFINLFSKEQDTRNKLYKESASFINFLQYVEQEREHYTIQLAIPPCYYDILEMPFFQKEMTEFLEKEKEHYEKELQYWKEHSKQLNKGISHLLSQNKIEILASAATFSELTNLTTEKGVRKHIDKGRAIIERVFNYKPTGFWFPNGSYTPGLDLHVKNAGFEFSFLKGETIKFSDPLPNEEGTAVVSPHGLMFFPIEESLITIIQNTQNNRNDIQNEIVSIVNAYNHYRHQGVITMAIELTTFNERRSELNKGMMYVMDEGFIANISPVAYQKQFKEDLDQVHLCASCLKNKDASTFIEFGPYYAAGSFIEKQWEYIIGTSDFYAHTRVVEQLEKEWFLLAGMLSEVNEENKELAENHIKAAEKLLSFLQGSCDAEWLQEREKDIPILNDAMIPAESKEIGNKENSNKKILILSWEYPPNIVGGLGTHVAGLTNSLAKKGYEVHLITAQNIKLEELDREEKAGLFVYRVKPLNSLEENFIHWVAGLNMRMWEKGMELAASIDFDCIQAHDWLVGAAAISLQKEWNVPLISTIHATEHGRNGGIHTEMQKFIHEKESQLIQESNGIIVCSDYMKEELIRIFQVDQNKIYIIPNGVDMSFSCETAYATISSLPITSEETVIFAIGRLVKEKGFGTLLEAAKKISMYNQKVCFVLAGVGPMYEEYKSYIEKNGLQSVVFLVGYLQEDKKKALYERADIVVIPSHYEPFGIVALESLVYGKPTIISNTGGLKAIVEHQKSGIVIEPANTEQLIQGIYFLLENDKKAEEIGKNGRKLVEQLFGWNRIGDETMRVFDEVAIQYKMKETVYEIGNS
ncbi:glycosyltransferase [Niallia sp. NCCP-28]|uniref:glycosyltransferase n=1 Tax=Niallia sp. NCCP-28 TaxID=2934712 RepID=UPI00207DA3CE|nr:glycosyltransferase [Niallia sp. NCCP-28]GKU81262.1 hypothetical protein NCCP28_06580 [Niallia sp. NCCP-28]